MVLAGSIASQFAEGMGMTAAAIAVAGFLAHAPWALTGRDERSLREATVIGGLGGFVVAAAIGLLSALGVV
jgi:hypothetical protein